MNAHDPSSAGFLGDTYAVTCPDCAAPGQSLCRDLNSGETRDFPHLNRVLTANGTPLVPSVEPRKLLVAHDGAGTAVTVELRVEKGVVVVDIDTNGSVDVDMYGETLAVIRKGFAQDF